MTSEKILDFLWRLDCNYFTTRQARRQGNTSNVRPWHKYDRLLNRLKHKLILWVYNYRDFRKIGE